MGDLPASSWHFLGHCRQSATAEFLSLRSHAKEPKGLVKAQGWGQRDVTTVESPGGGSSPVLERCRARSLSTGRALQLGDTKVGCASWSQLSVSSREMTDQDQLLS